MLALCQTNGFPVVLIDSLDSLKIYQEYVCESNLFKFKTNLNKYLNTSKDHSINGFIESITDEEYKRIVSLVLMKFGEDKFNLFDISIKINEFTFEKIQNFKKYIEAGKVISVNYNGGYSTHENMDHVLILFSYEGDTDIKEEEQLKNIKNFIINGKIAIDNITINKPVLVIENYSKLSDEMLDYISDMDYYVITDLFKHVSIHGKKYWSSVFTNALLNGLKTIIFETTGQNEQQYTLLFDLIKQHSNLIPDGFTIISNYDLTSKLEYYKLSNVKFVLESFNKI